MPKEAVEMMGRIAYQAEAALQYEEILSKKGLDRHKQSVTNAISFATCSIAQNLGAAAIIVSTESGHTAKMVSKYRPRRPIVAVTPHTSVVRKLALNWG